MGFNGMGGWDDREEVVFLNNFSSFTVILHICGLSNQSLPPWSHNPHSPLQNDGLCKIRAGEAAADPSL